MSEVKFVSGVNNKAGKIVDTSPKAKRLDPELIEKAFGAIPVGSSEGMDLFAIRNAMEKMLQSSGGRPSLEGKTSQVKIPKIDADWKKMEQLVSAVSSDLKYKPSLGQMAALIISLGLKSITENELKEALRGKSA